jgi:hypothetical protein
MARTPILRAMQIRQLLVPKSPLADDVRPALGYAVVLAILSALFAARVAAQAMQRWLHLPFLPPPGAFQGSALPYIILLPVQIGILAAMLVIAWRVHSGMLRPRPHVSRRLTVAGVVYVATMLTRLTIGQTVPDAPAWFRSEISTVFHFVLAIFVLALAAYHREPPRRAKEREAP